MSGPPMNVLGASSQVAEEQKGQQATSYSNAYYFPPPPSYALPTPQYDTPPIPAAYGNPANKTQPGPHDSYFAERPPFQQSQQPNWPGPHVDYQYVPYRPPSELTGYPPPPQYPLTPQTPLSPASQYPQPPSQPTEYPPPPQYPFTPQTPLSPALQYPQTPKSSLPPQTNLSSSSYDPSQGPPSPQTQFAPAPLFTQTPAITPTELAPAQPAEDPKSNGVKRFVGNMLVSRVVRASIQSVASSVTLPMYLSPWGDNNPVTLPNVRKRDVALAGGAYFGVAGLESLAPSVFEITGTAVDAVIQFAGKQVAEQVADEGIDKLKRKKPIKIVTTANIKSLEIRIKHKLIGKDAVIQMVGEYPVRHQLAYDKGWFCPYLYASGRTPAIPRAKDFGIAAFSSPGLHADAEVAPKLLSVIAQDTSIVELCDSNPSRNINCQRLLVLFLGLSPWRTHAWSQARNPNEARFRFHLINGIPALVLPVITQAPICAWSPWTLQQMQGTTEYHADTQYNELFNYLRTIISVGDVTGSMGNYYQDWLSKGLWEIIQSTQSTKLAAKEIEKVMDPKRAGIVMFKY